MPTNDERRKIAETLRSGVGTTDYMSDRAFIEWLFSVIGRSCDGHILDPLADLIEPEERTCRNMYEGAVKGPFTCSACGENSRTWIDIGFGDRMMEVPEFCPNCGAKVIQE